MRAEELKVEGGRTRLGVEQRSDLATLVAGSRQRSDLGCRLTQDQN